MAVTLIVGCRNRTEYLNQSLPTWIGHPQIKYIYIVDWGSDIPIILPTKSCKSDRGKMKKRTKVRVIRVEGVYRWVLSLALNFAAQFVKTEWMLKVDADTLLRPGFFDGHPISEGIFYSGNWRVARTENEKHLNGVIYLRTSDFRKVNGYNEYIRTYGYDDSDLYERLEKRGLTRRDFNFNLLTHQEHPDQIRDNTQDLRLSIIENMMICRKLQWTPDLIPTRYQSVDKSTYRPIDLEKYVPDPVLREEAKTLAMRCILNDKYRLSWFLTNSKSPSFIRQIYERRNRPVLIIDARNGLGNRLRAIASAAVIADKLERNLIIVWTPDYHNESKFSDLFETQQLLVLESPIFLEPVIAIQFAQPTGPTTSLSFEKPSGLRVEYIARHGENIDHLLDRQINLFIVSSCVLNSQLTDWTLESKWLRTQLNYLPEIRARISEMEKVMKINECIGVHIRMGQDSQTIKAESIQGWTPQSAKALIENRRLSHYIYFSQEISRILQDSPTQRFLVCADNEKIYRKLKKRFGDLILFYPRLHWDRSREQMVEALIEVVLLSKCQRVIGSPWSSYTELVSRLGGSVKIMGKDIPIQRFGAVYANSLNLGDIIQTLAAIQYYPNVDYWVERDHLDQVTTEMKIILNGWFDGRLTTWPPSKSLKIFPISMHINESSEVLKDRNYQYLIPSFKDRSMLDPTSFFYWKSIRPVGCRDVHTINLLRKIGIDSYLSSCLTLTLKRDPKWKRNNKIYNVDAEILFPSLYYSLVPTEIRAIAKPIRHGSLANDNSSLEKKIEDARRLLRKYGQAKYLITSRLHAALPALAYGTPVLFLYEKMERDPRFDESMRLILGDGRTVPSWWNWNQPQIPREVQMRIREIRRDLKEKVTRFVETI